MVHNITKGVNKQRKKLKDVGDNGEKHGIARCLDTNQDLNNPNRFSRLRLSDDLSPNTTYNPVSITEDVSKLHIVSISIN